MRSRSPSAVDANIIMAVSSDAPTDAVVRPRVVCFGLHEEKMLPWSYHDRIPLFRTRGDLIDFWSDALAARKYIRIATTRLSLPAQPAWSISATEFCTAVTEVSSMPLRFTRTIDHATLEEVLVLPDVESVLRRRRLTRIRR